LVIILVFNIAVIALLQSYTHRHTGYYSLIALLLFLLLKLLAQLVLFVVV